MSKIRSLAPRLCVAAAVAFPAFFVGCHDYTTVGIGELDPGDHVRARVSEDGLGIPARDDVGDGERRAGAHERLDVSATLEGQLRELEDGHLVLAVREADVREGYRVQRLHQRAVVAKDQVRMVERRETNRTRTGLIVAGASGAVLALLVTQLGSSTEGGGMPSGPPPGEL